MKEFITILASMTVSLLIAAPIAHADEQSVIQVNCNENGNATIEKDGETEKVNCGKNTPQVCGKIEKEEHCIGTAFPCMAGKECITISGGIKFHRTNCGSGGGEPDGNLNTAGCVVVSDEMMDVLEQSVGREYCVRGQGGSAKAGKNSDPWKNDPSDSSDGKGDYKSKFYTENDKLVRKPRKTIQAGSPVKAAQ